MAVDPGTRLSNDGQCWPTPCRVGRRQRDGHAIRGGAEFRHPRGTGPVFTPDSKLVIFTIVPPRAEQEAEPPATGGQPAQAPIGGAVTPGPGTAGGRGGGAGGGGNSLGIMTLADGRVTTIERVTSFRLPDDSSTWLAYQRGNANGRGGRGGRRGAAPEPATTTAEPAAAGGAAPAAPAAPQEKRKDPGTDLVIRDLASSQETTIPEVTEFTWDKKGVALAYAVSSNDAAKDGVFVRQMSDGATRPLHSGRGHYKSLAFDSAGAQLAFLSDREHDKPVAPYRPTTGAGRKCRRRGGAVRHARYAAWHGGQRQFAPRFGRWGRLYGHGPAACATRGGRPRKGAGSRPWSSKDALIQPMQQLRANQSASAPRAVVHLERQAFRAARDAGGAGRESRRRPIAIGVGPAVSAGDLLGRHDATSTSPT